MKKILSLLFAFATSASLASNASSPHPLPLHGGHGPGQSTVQTAGVVSYNSGQNSGLSAIFRSSIQFGDSTTPGYLVTGGPAGLVGWNVPSVAAGNVPLPMFYGAKFCIASPTNFSSTVPFQIVVQTTDGATHSCKGSQGTYRFNPAQPGANAYSSYTVYSNQFTPSMNLFTATVQKTAFIFTGTGTVGLCGGVVVGDGTSLNPDYYSYTTSPDTKFNFQ